MKSAVLLIILFAVTFTTSTWACPDLAGQYHCGPGWDEMSGDITILQKQDESDPQSVVYTIQHHGKDDVIIKTDQKTSSITYPPNYQNEWASLSAIYSYSCKDNSVVGISSWSAVDVDGTKSNWIVQDERRLLPNGNILATAVPSFDPNYPRQAECTKQ